MLNGVTQVESTGGCAIDKVKVDLHIHSYVSDGGMSPEEAVRFAEKIGLVAISITDHNTFLGSRIALEKRNRVIVVPGAEFRTELGDILLLCEHIPLVKARQLKSKTLNTGYVELLSIVDLATRENCVTIAAHPFALVKKSCGRLFELKYLDCVEVYNSSSDIVTNIYTAYVARNKKCRIAGSDAHILELIGSAYTLIDVDEVNIEGIIESIRKAKVEPRYDIDFWILKSLTSIKDRLIHLLRTKLGNYGDPWERVSLYPV